MSALGALWAASLLGAALFLAAGYLAAVVQRRRVLFGAGVAGDVFEPHQFQDDHAEERAAAAALERDSARAQLEGARAELAGARQEVSALEHASQSFERRLAAAEARARAGEDAERVLGKVTEESKHLREESRALSAKVGDLTTRLDEAARRAEGADRLRDVDTQRRDLTLRVGVLEGRLRDAEHLREENASLRAALRDRALLEEKLRAAERRLSDAEDWEPPVAAAAPDARPKVVDGTGRDRLRSILTSLTRHDGVRAALFADDLGFPVEAAGEHAESLAALSGVLAGAAVKARQILPLGPAVRIVVVDDRQVTITARRQATDYGPLALITLTDGPSPEVDALPAGA